MSAVLEERPIEWIPVGRLTEIPVRGARRVLDGETVIALFRTADDTVHALEDRCPHKGGPLSEGIVHGDCVTCPLHNWVIGLDDGEARGADEGTVRRYDVRLDGEDIHLGMDRSVNDNP